MKFTKMHGLGNSYIYIDLFEEELEERSLSELAVYVSDKHRGIGADGLILIEPSRTEDARMRIFNADGSEAMTCGNGLRCTAKYVFEKKYVDNERFTIETKGGTVKATVHPDHSKSIVDMVTIDMGRPRLQKKQIPMLSGDPEKEAVGELLEAGGTSFEVTALSMGNPHAVLFVDDTKEAPVHTLGPVLEKHEFFPERANIEFVHVLSETEMDFRVWERGSGETQACGTGACAAVAAAVLNGKIQKNKEITVHLPGGDLFITWHQDGHITMNGAAETICEGILKNRPR
ncbi:diaminopimelate epimerase [Sinobaca sp. H24]|uniref:diaminopimelate epimerase n=1 Tax=Sinobaca sp. H24 TaxID=2923376 RepID=UPI00207951A0|nr:diaminopimelate epimerase [Sinobaca sp. H24]